MFCHLNRLLPVVITGLLYSSLVTSLKIAGAFSVIEYTPLLVASQDFYKGDTQVVSGGVADLLGNSNIDLAGNAETQALRQYASHKNLRIIYTVVEVAYRIVANKKSGISSLQDLKGKKIGTIPSTSAAYFVQKYLATVGLQESDYTAVSGSNCNTAPCGAGTLPYMLSHGSVDAVGMWEPTLELAIEALGSGNAVVFQNKTIYQEVYNLYTTAEKLKDPTTHKNIVAYIQALEQAAKMFTADPEKSIPRVASIMNMNETVVRAVWPVHDWKGGLASDLLDVLVPEDQWVAKVDHRSAISKTDLATMIDASVVEEATSTSFAGLVK